MKLHLDAVLHKEWCTMVNHKLIIPGIFFIVCQFFFSNLIAQNDSIGKEETSKRIEEASRQMYAGNYEVSYQEFKDILDEAKSLPPEICYYFGVNSFQLKKYKQSINWLNKYLELVGTNGEHSESCETYLELAEETYRTENKENENMQSDSPYASEELAPANYDINEVLDCSKYGKIICPVCKGKGVIIKEGLFGKEYQTCPYCDDYGYMSCKDYNLLLQGKLQPKKKE